MFNKYLNHIRNPNIKTVIFKNKKFQFLVEMTNSRLHSPSLHDYYCVFNNVRLFNSRYINYDPHSHEFKNEICISHNNNNNKYSIIGSKMKNLLVNNNKIKIGLTHDRNVGNGSMSRSSRSISSRSRSSRSISSRSISSRSRSSRSRSSRSNGKIIPKKSFVILFNSSKINRESSSNN